MKSEYLELFKCPRCCATFLKLESDDDGERIVTGVINCQECGSVYPIRNRIPRFSESTSYAESFGPQWKAFAKSQIDSDRIKESQIRFESEIGWGKKELEDKRIVEFGSGAGRFIDIVSGNGAELVVGLDATDAVDAAQENLAGRDNVLFVQGDIFSHPFREASFDYGYSVGVLHHTPDPEDGFRKLSSAIKPNGKVAVSLYDVSNYSRPNRNSLKNSTMELLYTLNEWRCELFRVVTSRLPERLFLKYCRVVVPLLHFINKIPVIRYIRYLFPSTCYSHLPVIWSMVDTHDTYATKIVHKYRGRDVFQWFLHEGMSEIILRNSRAGWVSVTAIVSDKETKERRRLYIVRPGEPGKDAYSSHLKSPG